MAGEQRGPGQSGLGRRLPTELVNAVADHTAPPPDPVHPERASRPAGDHGHERALLTVGSPATRPGGAVAAGEALAGAPGVVHVSLDPFTGRVRVDHDPARCGTEQLVAALAGEAADRLAG